MVPTSTIEAWLREDLGHHDVTNQVPGETTSQGIELSGEYALSPMITLFGAYTFTKAETDGVRLTRTPKHDAVVGIDARFTDRFSGYFDVRHVADVKPSNFAPAGNKVGDYTLVGAGIAYEVSDMAELYLRLENMPENRHKVVSK
mgnify:CR=1 FL=1